jgi:radical SAM superfamily enzyme YgiQ (UPF0313 family)
MSRLFIMPRYGTVAVASALSRAGYEVRAFCEFVGSEIDWDYVRRADTICFGLMSFCAERGFRLADQLREITSAPIIFGGAHATVKPGECLKHGDFVVRNEGEGPLLALLEALKAGCDCGGMAGISFRENGRVQHNPDQQFLEEQEIDHAQDISLLVGYTEMREHFSLPRPRVHLQTVQTSRGCPHNCSFCAAPRELGRRYRTKSLATVLADLRDGICKTGSHTFIFVDNDFTVDVPRTEKLLTALADEFEGDLNLTVFSRLSVAEQPRLLKLFRRAGVRQLFVGIESVNEATLRQYRKRQTLDQIALSLDVIHAHGIRTMGAIILGGEADTPETITRSLDFAMDHGVHLAQFYSLYDFPGKEYELGIPQAIADHRFIHRDWRLFNSAFVVHYPRHMRPSTLQQGIIDAYERFYARERLLREENLDAYSRMAAKLFIVNPNLRLMRQYLPILKEMEHGLYDDNEELLEQRLLRDNGGAHQPLRLELKLEAW